MSKKIKISGVGCSLVDRLYKVSFSNDSYQPFLSKQSGDGGLTPGQLVFREEFEKFANEDFNTALPKLTNNQQPVKINIGGPSIVSLIHASQITDNDNIEFCFYGNRGDDDDGNFIISLLEKTKINTDNYTKSNAETPSTVVLSDDDFDNGNGERMFINSIGAAWDFTPENLDEAFFDSDIVVFGATALVPNIHDNLTELLKKAKVKNCITIVNTVYDFRNEKAAPDIKWPLGNSDESYANIDLLMTDLEEALRLSGKGNLNDAMQFFQERKTGSVIVTCGAQNVHLFSLGKLFKTLEHSTMPVSKLVTEKLKTDNSGDTTGCGDNFAGGVIASLAKQLQNEDRTSDLTEACSWGIVSGGTTCFYMGGMFEEKQKGEKLNRIMPFYTEYKKQFTGF